MGTVDDKDLQHAGQEAGEAVRAQMLEALKARKVTPDLVALRLKQLMNWKEVKLFQYGGSVIESEKYKSGGIIMKATALVADIFGARAPEKVEHSGGVTILRPDPITKREK